jgi:O-antigen ligase
VGVFVWFFMYETVPFFSARFWFIVWALVNFIWFYFIARAILQVPQKKEEYERLQQFKKYLP